MELSSFDIGKRILGRIKQLSKTQTEVCNEVNISKTAMSNYVNGNRVPDTLTTLKLSKALNVSVEWLLTGEGELPESSAAPVDDSDKKLSIDEKVLLNNYRDMDEDDKEKLHLKAARLLSVDKAKNILASPNSTGEESATTESIG